MVLSSLEIWKLILFVHGLSFIIHFQDTGERINPSINTYLSFLPWRRREMKLSLNSTEDFTIFIIACLLKYDLLRLLLWYNTQWNNIPIYSYTSKKESHHPCSRCLLMQRKWRTIYGFVARFMIKLLWTGCLASLGSQPLLLEPPFETSCQPFWKVSQLNLHQKSLRFHPASYYLYLQKKEKYWLHFGEIWVCCKDSPTLGSS